MKTIVRMPTAAICLAGLMTASLCLAEPRPLWEVGAGGALINFPDYRGANERSTYLLPLPYFVYRGEILRADRSGLRGVFFESDKLQVNVSLNGSLPVNSEDNITRRGMADLEPTVELGPTLDVSLWQSPDQKMKLGFRAPVRTSFTVESSPRQTGWLFSPNFRFDVKDPAGWDQWRAGLFGGPIFSSRKYNAHFYSVSPSEATPLRPAYTATGGYSGSQITMTLSKRFPRYWVGGFLRYDTVSRAVFADSPLVKKSSGVSAGIGVAWVFKESSTTVDAEE